MNILLSWYGISDYRALTRQSVTDGPLLSALLELTFTDLFLLCPIDEYNIENSPETHTAFLKWYKERLTDAGKTTNVTIVPATVSGLDDLDSIRAVERRAFHFVSQNVGEGDIFTVYLSPGTSLMAFAWGEIIREYPNTNVRLLISPRVGSKPIYIPY